MSDIGAALVELDAFRSAFEGAIADLTYRDVDLKNLLASAEALARGTNNTALRSGIAELHSSRRALRNAIPALVELIRLIKSFETTLQGGSGSHFAVAVVEGAKGVAIVGDQRRDGASDFRALTGHEPPVVPSRATDPSVVSAFMVSGAMTVAMLPSILKGLESGWIKLRRKQGNDDQE